MSLHIPDVIINESAVFHCRLYHNLFNLFMDSHLTEFSFPPL